MKLIPKVSAAKKTKFRKNSMSKTGKMPVSQKQSRLIKNNLKKENTGTLIWNILPRPTSCKNNCAVGVGHSFLSCAAKITSTCAQEERLTSSHLLPPIIILDCKTAG